MAGWFRRDRWKAGIRGLGRWVSADLQRAVGSLLLAVILLVVGNMLDASALFHRSAVLSKVVALAGAVVFAAVGVFAVRAMANLAADRSRPRMSASHVSAIRLVVSIAGYLCVAVVLLNTLGVNLNQLLVGGALTGVVVGIAAQQSLGNVFAGIVLMAARPFAVGDRLRISSGALGGDHEGIVTEMGLVYLTLQGEDGLVRLPNSSVLNSAASPNRRRPVEPEVAPADEDEPAA